MATPTLIGHIEPFQLGSDDWDQYTERLEQYFLANGIPEDKRVAAFVTIVGGKTYSLMSNILAPRKPPDLPYADLVAAMKAHLKPKPLVIVERFQFHRRNQAESESVSEYVAELRKLADRCVFGEYLEQALRDRLVCGLRNEAIQRRLLTLPDLTLKKAFETAHGMEVAQKQASELQISAKIQPSTVQYVKKTPAKQPSVTSPTSRPASTSPCYRCGKSNHPPDKCFYKRQQCRACKGYGHIAKMCKRAGRTDFLQGGVDADDDTPEEEPLDESEMPLMNIQVVKPMSSPSGLMIEMVIDGKPLSMELDTGASVSIISEDVWKGKFRNRPLDPSAVRLKTYTGQRIKVLGQRTVMAEYGEDKHRLPLIVVEGSGPSLFGRNWLDQIRLDWGSIKSIRSQLDELLSKHQVVFKRELGTLKGMQAGLELKPGAQPRFYKARSVPYALKEAIEQDLCRLEQLGIIEKVNCSEWATPVVPVPKSDGSVRLCGDYKITINPELRVDQYPMPTAEDLFATLAGGKIFSKLDLSQAYQQVLLEPDSRKYVTVSTHKGLYRYTRLPFGVASAPAMFQQIMERVLQGIPNVVVYLDDILVTGKDEPEHLLLLGQVLSRLEEHGLRLKREKCYFMDHAVDYLGYHVDGEGLHPMASKVSAIVEAPEPQDVKELRAFLGLVNYYGKFIRQLATLTQPLNQLLCKGTPWKWNKACQVAFKQLKTRLASSEVLVHYDVKLPIRLDCDASAYGVGAVLSHVFPDGSERPIAYASRTLSQAERNYAQIEKEGLALIYGVKKFHKFIYGRRFTLVTDHQPLLAILGSKKSLPTLAAARLQRWAIFLLGYQYDLEFRSTQQHCNADGFSRLPLTGMETESLGKEAVTLNLHQIESLPLTTRQIREATSKEVILSRVLDYTMNGWPNEPAENVKAYHRCRLELSVEAGCLLRGMRVVVPKVLRSQVLNELHASHLGMVRMKGLARSRVWWPDIGRDIEQVVHNCDSCQQLQRQPPPTRLHPWPWPTGPWERIHVDFAGPFLGSMFFVIVDAYSKWLEVIEMSSTTAGKTVSVLRHLFARYGLPQVLVSDNGPQFTAAEFSDFMLANGIRHLRGAPYHPASNGEAERFVQTFKQSMLRGKNDKGTVAQKLAQFLLINHTTPHATTGVPPAELFMKRQLRTRLDVFRPSVKEHVERKQQEQRRCHDQRARDRTFEMGQLVLVRNLRDGPKWVYGRIHERVGSISYKVEVGDQLWMRHADQLLAYHGSPDSCTLGSAVEEEPVESGSLADNVPENLAISVPEPVAPSLPNIPSESEGDLVRVPMEQVSLPEHAGEASPPSTSLAATPPQIVGKQYPRRIRHPPERFEPSFQ